MARVNDDQFYLPPTRSSTSWMSHTCLYFPAAESHRTLAGTHFPSRPVPLAWVAWWITEVVCLPKTVTHPVLTGPDVE